MKKLTACLVAIMVVSGVIFALGLDAQKFSLSPNSSKSFKRIFAKQISVKIQISGGDLGSGRIIAEVFNPNGKRVASGSNEIRFNTKNAKGKYKIVLTNKTRKRQDIDVSIFKSQ